MDSEDDGEAWIWGDFVAILQKNPRTCESLLEQISARNAGKKPSALPSHMEYPYAMMVYYKRHRNPHGPSSRPVMCVGIEQMNFGALKNMLGDSFDQFAKGMPTHGKGPLVLGVFKAEERYNLGELDEILSRDTARAKFFEVIRSELNPEGTPIQIGDRFAISGHPETGWPAIEKEQKKSGCLGLFVGMAILIPIALGVFARMA